MHLHITHMQINLMTGCTSILLFVYYNLFQYSVIIFQLLKQLGRLFEHSPALCVALIAQVRDRAGVIVGVVIIMRMFDPQYPVCHGFLVKHLNDYFSQVAESNSTVQTTLESETSTFLSVLKSLIDHCHILIVIVPLLKQYLALSQQLEVLLSTPISAVSCVHV